MKESFSNVEVCKKITILKKEKSVNDICCAHFEAVLSEHSITEEKKKDLRAMIPYLHHEEYRAFYIECLVIMHKLKWHSSWHC